MNAISESHLFSRFIERVTYGSSMGGYEASAFAECLEADRATLIHPISSSSAECCPWESRFERVKNADWVGSYADSVISVKNIPLHIIYDPLHGLDALHAKRYSNRCNEVEPVKMQGWVMVCLGIFRR